jgi:hypothetical protein
MRVLVLESEPGGADRAIHALRAASHTVERCHEVGHASFPCRAIDSPSECPLANGAVDVALTVRTEERWTTSELEDGVACAIRSHVPLVVAGATAGNPYQPWTTATVSVDDEIVDVCAWAASAPLVQHSRVASERLREVLVRNDVQQAGSADVEVIRRNGRLRVLLRVPGGVSADVADVGATYVLAAVRALDPTARGIDVSVTTVDP